MEIEIELNMKQKRPLHKKVYWHLFKGFMQVWAVIANLEASNRLLAYTLLAIFTVLAVVETVDDKVIPVWQVVMGQLLLTYYLFKIFNY